MVLLCMKSLEKKKKKQKTKWNILHGRSDVGGMLVQTIVSVLCPCRWSRLYVFM